MCPPEYRNVTAYVTANVTANATANVTANVDVFGRAHRPSPTVDGIAKRK